MGIREAVAFFLVINPILTVLVGSMFLGEDVLVFLAILSGKGMIPVWIIIVFGVIGIILGDIFYFSLGKTWFVRGLEKKLDRSRKLRVLYSVIHYYAEKNRLLTMIVSKYVYGIRLLVIFYMSARGMNLRKFLPYNLLATSIWAMIMLPAGWLVGRGISWVFNAANDIKKIITIAVIIFLAYYIIERLVAHFIVRKALKHGEKFQLNTNSGTARISPSSTTRKHPKKLS